MLAHVAKCRIRRYVTALSLPRAERPCRAAAGLPARLKKRDLRLFAIFVGGLAGHPFAGVVAVGVLSHVCVLVILSRGWRLAAPAD